MHLKQGYTIGRHIRSIACGLLAVVMLAACGGGSSGGSDTQAEGSLSFAVQWDRETASKEDVIRYGVDDCADVDTVTAAVYDTVGDLLQTGGPWSCTDGQGIVSHVPADQDVRVAVAGHSTSGQTLYRGQSNAFFLPAGGSVDAGVIVAPAFAVTLTSPANGAAVSPLALTLTWNAVTGAEHYVVEIAHYDASGYNLVNQETLTVTSTSCRPDTTLMSEETLYLWRVQVVDTAGNASEFSGYRQFYINRNLLSVTITTPVSDAVVLLGDSVTFAATVTDPEGNPLTDSDLARIEWSSSQDGLFASGQLTVAADTLSAGSHTVTLSVTDADGLYGSASVNLRVNQPPTAVITAPAVGYQFYLCGECSFECTGTGADPEDGTLTGASLQWELISNDSGDVFLSGSGENFIVDELDIYPAFFSTGMYTVRLTATDSDGAATTVTLEIEFVGYAM